MGQTRLVIAITSTLALTGCYTVTARPDATYDPASGKAVLVMGTNCLSMENNGCRVELYNPASPMDRLAHIIRANTMHYGVFIVNPGRYTLKGTVHTNGRVQCHTNIQPPEKLDGAYGIDLKAGEIVYAGDLVFGATKCPISILGRTRDRKNAQAALDNYRGIKGEMLDRSWFTATPKLTPSTEKEPAS